MCEHFDYGDTIQTLRRFKSLHANRAIADKFLQLPREYFVQQYLQRKMGQKIGKVAFLDVAQPFSNCKWFDKLVVVCPSRAYRSCTSNLRVCSAKAGDTEFVAGRIDSFSLTTLHIES